MSFFVTDEEITVAGLKWFQEKSGDLNTALSAFQAGAKWMRERLLQDLDKLDKLAELIKDS